MIKEIFLPEKTKTRRLISRRIIGLSIQETVVSATQINATPRITLIEKLHEEPIPPGAPGSYNDRLSQAVKNVLAKLSKYDQIRVSIPSSIVTFKELTLPFTDIEKIKMVIEYEVEPMLPFSLQDAVVDFIITSQNKTDKTSQILVAAVRKQDLQIIFDAYQTAGVDPGCITVDLFALYGLYLQIDEYKDTEGASALVDIGSTTTSVSFLLNGQIRLIRSISKGLHTIAQHISEDTDKSIEETLQDLINFGKTKTNDEKYSQAAQKYLTSFLTDIQFTLNSFSLKLNFYKAMSKILFIGKGTQIKDLMAFGNNLLQIPCEKFSCDKLFKTSKFKNKTKKLIPNWTKYTITLGTAIPYGPHDEFNLRKKEFAKTRFPLLNKQLFTAVALTIMLFGTIITRGVLQVRNLTGLTKRSEKQAIMQLKKIFPARHAALKKKRLRALFRSAQQIITEREEAWLPFLQENLKPLEILKDLTLTMDKRTFNIKIEKIAIEVEDDGAPGVEVAGLFSSQKGPGSHFADYDNFAKFFEGHSKLLTIKDTDIDLADEGVKFTFNLKLKEPL